MLTEFVAKTAEQFGIPGVAVGVLMDGAETVVTHGVTNVLNPQPVDRDTLFHIASVSSSARQPRPGPVKYRDHQSHVCGQIRQPLGVPSGLEPLKLLTRRSRLRGIW